MLKIPQNSEKKHSLLWSLTKYINKLPLKPVELNFSINSNTKNQTLFAVRYEQNLCSFATIDWQLADIGKSVHCVNRRYQLEKQAYPHALYPLSKFWYL